MKRLIININEGKERAVINNLNLDGCTQAINNEPMDHSTTAQLAHRLQNHRSANR
jgi:hypothetical protein